MIILHKIIPSVSTCLISSFWLVGGKIFLSVLWFRSYFIFYPGAQNNQCFILLYTTYLDICYWVLFLYWSVSDRKLWLPRLTTISHFARIFPIESSDAIYTFITQTCPANRWRPPHHTTPSNQGKGTNRSFVWSFSENASLTNIPSTLAYLKKIPCSPFLKQNLPLQKAPPTFRGASAFLLKKK